MKALAMIAALAMLAGAAPLAAGTSTAAGPGHCPPGLAKKNPPCVPPGLAKKGALPDDWRGSGSGWLTDYSRHGLPHPGTGKGYVRIGDILVLVDRDTLEILALFDLLGRALN